MPGERPLDDEIDRDDPSPEDMARFGGDPDDDDGADDDQWSDYDDEAFDAQPGRWSRKPSALKRGLIIVGIALAAIAAIMLSI